MAKHTPLKNITPCDLPALDFANYQPPRQAVRRNRRGDFELDGGGYWYSIERHRLDTPDKLIRWLLHLSTTKGWLGPANVRQLIEEFSAATGPDFHETPS